MLEPSDPELGEQSSERPTVHQWLAFGGFEVDPTIIASVRNESRRRRVHGNCTAFGRWVPAPHYRTGDRTGTGYRPRILRRHRFAVKISIVTASLNQGGFIARTAESVLSQTGDFDLEWIVIDGVSTDESLPHPPSNPRSPARLISEPDRGQSDAINKGMAMSTGDVVAWLNADDLYAPSTWLRSSRRSLAIPNRNGW